MARITKKKSLTKVTISKYTPVQKLLIVVFLLVFAGVGSYLTFNSHASVANGPVVYKDNSYIAGLGHLLRSISVGDTTPTPINGTDNVSLSFVRHPSSSFVAYVDGATYRYPNNGTGEGRVTTPDGSKTYTFVTPPPCTSGSALKSIGEMSFKRQVVGNMPRIAYTIDTTPNCNPNRTSATTSQLYVANADGSNKSLLLSGAHAFENLEWSAESNKIYFLSCDGLTIQGCRLIVRTDDGAHSTVKTLINPPLATFSLSGDGKKIVFDRASFNYNNTNPIYVMNSDGTNIKPIPNTSNIYRGALSKSALSNAGSTMLLQATSLDNKHSQLQAVRVDGSKNVVLSNSSNTTAFNFAWSPNGDWIVYSYADVTNNISGINTIKPDGSARTQLVKSNDWQRYALGVDW